jgi:hypothetical protein
MHNLSAQEGCVKDGRKLYLQSSCKAMSTIPQRIFGVGLKIPQFLYHASFPKHPAKLSEHPLSS